VEKSQFGDAQNAESLDAPINVPNADLRDHEGKGQEKMAQVLISFKIYPTDIMDLNELKQKIERQLPKYAKLHKTAEEPIAFGLNALIAQILIPEKQEGALDQLEQVLQKIPEVSQIQTIMVSRT